MLETAITAARRAGAILREHFENDPNVDAKEAHDIRLEVDRLCEAAIVGTLGAAFPDDAILAEESGAAGEGSRRWIIDPLDGTANYFYGVPHFCTSIALEIDGVPTVGVVYDPIRDEMFTAEVGQGACRNGQPIRVSPVTDPAEASVVLGFMKDEGTMRMGLQALGDVIYRVRKIRCTGSAALDLAYVAAGRYTAYYEAGIKLWDISAGLALLNEAGGRHDIREAGGRGLNIFASNGGVHDALQECFPL